MRNESHMAPNHLSRRTSIAALELAGQGLANAITLPYYRFYRQNTLLPIQAIAKSVQDGESADVIAEKLKRWRDRKLHEFQFVQVAATLLAAAVIGCFSWTPQNDAQQHWLGPAAWYCSLILSVTAVLLSSSEAVIFSAIKNAPPPPPPTTSIPPSPPPPPPPPTVLGERIMPRRLAQELSMIIRCEADGRNEPQPISKVATKSTNTRFRASSSIPRTNTILNNRDRHRPDDSQQQGLDLNLDPDPDPDLEEAAAPGTHPYHHHHHGPGDPVRVSIRWNMVFTWQAPIMLMGYSVLAFFIGLVIYICTPLYDGHEGPYLNGPAKGAIFFLVWSAVSGGIFMWCSFWAYRFVELDEF